MSNPNLDECGLVKLTCYHLPMKEYEGYRIGYMFKCISGMDEFIKGKEYRLIASEDGGYLTFENTRGTMHGRYGEGTWCVRIETAKKIFIIAIEGLCVTCKSDCKIDKKVECEFYVGIQ